MRLNVSFISQILSYLDVMPKNTVSILQLGSNPARGQNQHSKDGRGGKNGKRREKKKGKRQEKKNII